MYKVKTLNNISQSCVGYLRENGFDIGDGLESPEVIFVRALNSLDYEFGPELLCIARAGIGVNTIPLARCAEKGIVVFNTPGGNANGVKELFLFGLGMACRDIKGAMDWVDDFDKSTGEVSKVMEKIKAQFAGPEYMGKKIGVVGMGNVGRIVANACVNLGMDVYGYDPFLSVDAAWLISNQVTKVDSLSDLYDCDFLTLHCPLTDLTRNLVNADYLAHMKDGVRIINYARQQVVNEEDMIAALESGKVARYVTDFPTNNLVGRKNVVMTPHLGGTTHESEENCAIMAARQAVDYIKNGNIVNSVNFGKAVMSPSLNARLCIFHKNVPNVLAGLTSSISKRGINIENMVNASTKEYPIAYTMLELGSDADEELLNAIQNQKDVVRVRAIPSKQI